MFVFKKEQKAFDFGGIHIGGNPGENPTVAIGGLFFRGQRVVKSSKKGRFDEVLAKEWIERAKDMEQKTGHPFLIQIYGRTATAMENHLSWLVENYDGPFMFESTSSKARKRGIEYCDGQDLENRAIYNSINLSMKDDEKKLLEDSSLHMAVVLGWSPRATTLKERMEVIETMLDEATDMGIDKMVVDPATMPVGAGYGLDYRTIIAIKSELGLPTCLGPHNAPSAWKFLRRPELDNPETHLAAIVASTTAAQVLATDCIMYGSMARTEAVYTAFALIGNAIASAAAESHRALGLDSDIFEPTSFE
ncbi:MAG: hypothetical protein GF309_08730 [Candidatus Lokiarchaeota archaeon]|nr:hypothetical protein [Candidatus Lokiarchaeota archaeon]